MCFDKESLRRFGKLTGRLIGQRSPFAVRHNGISSSTRISVNADDGIGCIVQRATALLNLLPPTIMRIHETAENSNDTVSNRSLPYIYNLNIAIANEENRSYTQPQRRRSHRENGLYIRTGLEPQFLTREWSVCTPTKSVNYAPSRDERIRRAFNYQNRDQHIYRTYGEGTLHQSRGNQKTAYKWIHLHLSTRGGVEARAKNLYLN